jgi:phosphoadenosine phosphosulfate reductase
LLSDSRSETGEPQKVSELPKLLRERADDSISQLRSAVAEFKNVCYANSLGPESIVLTDLIWGAVQGIEMFTIDTGRLYPQTYDLIERLQQRYGRSMAVFYPNAERLEGWVGENAAFAR